VGVGKWQDPYIATMRALEASMGWPQVDGKKVIIKPNLVNSQTAETGVTTDPQVVRAMVDVALQTGAAEVFIVEQGFSGANFSSCGYGFFQNYDPRVRLVDLTNEPVSLAPVPGGMVYREMYLPSLLLGEDVFFVSVAKLKTHSTAHATLSMKNLVGIAPIHTYRYPQDEWRLAIHDRGIHQAIVDLNLCRPVDFALVDGVVAMEGNGPAAGSPVSLGMVLAGKNAVAVDRVCLDAAALPQGGVLHLTYASKKGLGPATMDEIELLGDPYTPVPFKWPQGLPPLQCYPTVSPMIFAPKRGGKATIKDLLLPYNCLRKVEVVLTSDVKPAEVTVVRLLSDWQARAPGIETLTWDGRDDNGAVVSPGLYTVRINAKYDDSGHNCCASGWVIVV
jgi:uncharacterized protein (DUF362 family)